jgi:hypothetical protein
VLPDRIELWLSTAGALKNLDYLRRPVSFVYQRKHQAGGPHAPWRAMATKRSPALTPAFSTLRRFGLSGRPFLCRGMLGCDFALRLLWLCVQIELFQPSLHLAKRILLLLICCALTEYVGLLNEFSH